MNDQQRKLCERVEAAIDDDWSLASHLLRAMANSRRRKSFHDHCDGPDFTDQAAGKILGDYAAGEHSIIIRAAAAALEDWNHHEDAAKVRALADTACPNCHDDPAFGMYPGEGVRGVVCPVCEL